MARVGYYDIEDSLRADSPREHGKGRAPASAGALHTRDMRTRVGWIVVLVQAVLLVLLVVVPRVPLSPGRLVAGLIIIVLAGLLGAWSGMRLGSALTPTPVPIPGAELRTDGPYALVRHPIYAAVLLAAVGYTVALGSWWTLLTLALLTGFFIVKYRWEDRMLREVHGEQWATWARSTGALLPRRLTHR